MSDNRPGYLLLITFVIEILIIFNFVCYLAATKLYYSEASREFLNIS